jgi:hypothetical protein
LSRDFDRAVFGIVVVDENLRVRQGAPEIVYDLADGGFFVVAGDKNGGAEGFAHFFTLSVR